MRRKNRGLLILLSFPVVLLYIVLYSLPLGKETMVVPVWFSNVERGAEKGNTDKTEKSFPFILKDYFGYMDFDGHTTYFERRDFYTTMSPDYFINYGRIPENYFIKGKSGRIESVIKAYGYPILSETGKTIVVVTTDLSGLSAMDASGSVKFNEQFSSVITSLKFNDDMFLIGLLSGKAILEGRDGKVLFSLEPEGSSVPVVLGVSLSKRNDRLAIVHGLNPQILSIVERGKNGFEVKRNVDMGTDFRREVLIRFSDNGRFLFYRDNRGISIIDIDNWDRKYIPLGGEVTGIATEGKDNIYPFISRGKGDDSESYNFEIIKPMAFVVFKKSFKRELTFIKKLDNHIFVGLNNMIVRLDIEEL